MTDTLRDLIECRLGGFLEASHMAFVGGAGDAMLVRRQFAGPTLFLEATVDRRENRLTLSIGRCVDGEIPQTPFIISKSGARTTSVSVTAIDLVLTGDHARRVEPEALLDESLISLREAINRQADILEGFADRLLDGDPALIDRAASSMDERAARLRLPPSHE